MEPKSLPLVRGYKFRHLDEKKKNMTKPPDLTAMRMAWMLRACMANARDCPDRRCRRQDMCSRPPLKCLHRPRADQFDWDWGWFGCKRKDMYGLEEDAWMPGIMGGPPEYRERQRREHLKMRKMIKMKFNKDPGPE
jgi:hypothetical protein